MKKILIDMQIHEASLEKLKALEGVQVITVEPSEEPRHLPEPLIKDVNFLFCTCPPENLEKMIELEVIQIASAGYTQLFGLDLNKKAIRACNAAGVNDIPIAQWNIAMMINLLRDIRGMIRNQESRTWERSPRFQRDIRGMTAGIWGYGGIGRETARLAKALGIKVHVMDLCVKPRPNMYVVPGTGDPEGIMPDKIFSPDAESEFLSSLDFLILSMPLTKNTEGIISEKQLSSLPRSCFILNPARGPLIKERSLIDALDKHLIAGAALDTHYYYPMPPDHPLWKYPNVIMTPHISGSTLSPNFLELLWDVATQNIQRFLSGKELLNRLTESQLEGY